MQKAKRALLLILQPRCVTQNFRSHFIGWCLSAVGWRSLIFLQEGKLQWRTVHCRVQELSKWHAKGYVNGPRWLLLDSSGRVFGLFWKGSLTTSSVPGTPSKNPKVNQWSLSKLLVLQMGELESQIFKQLALNLLKQQLIGSRTTSETVPGRGNTPRHSKRLQTV